VIFEFETKEYKISLDNLKLKIIGDRTREYNIEDIKESYIVLKIKKNPANLNNILSVLFGYALYKYIIRKYILNNNFRKVLVFKIHILFKNEPFEEIINCNEKMLDSDGQKYSVIKRNADMLVMFLNKWLIEAENLKKRVPSFDIENEMKNPLFFNCLSFLSSSQDSDSVAKAYLNVLKHTKD